MSDPATLEDYIARSKANISFTGGGADRITHLPCPGCAAAGWKDVSALVGLDNYDTKASTCGECQRSFRIEITKSANGIDARIIQTSGPPKADYLPSVIPFV